MAGSLVTGTLDSSMTFFPFGAARTGSVSTDKKFTDQRLDGTGLYYYGARYYDATIGRFISPDSVGQKLTDPQSLNRYTYCSNNPLRYTDPTGHWSWNTFFKVVVIVLAVVAVVAVAIVAPALLAALAPALAAPIAAAITGAATGAAAYTASKIVTNTLTDQAPLQSWNAAECATAAAGNAILGYGTSIICNALTSAATSTSSAASSTSTELSPYRYTQDGESFIRYESPTFPSRITQSGGVTPNTYAAPVSDGLIPENLRNSYYNLPMPDILRPDVYYLNPSAGTPIIGPRPVIGGIGNEVNFWWGY